MEKILDLVTRMRRKNFVLSSENLAKIVSRYSFDHNNKETRRAIAADINRELKIATNDSHSKVIDSTLPSEEDQEIMAFLIMAGNTCQIIFIYPSGQTTSTETFKN